ncbi:class I SAM-dependent methyltransferase [Elongatibacter sediminis]|uniref:Class I SAM-dependent methyltransferase n=1 Tax=Elongatibacter sediminis TaxID=3119006 RepID=A0AAW9RK70_9GAMM
MNNTARFWDRIAQRYARRPVADEDSYQQKLRLTREYLRPDMHVLEFGCGTGSTALVHAPHVARIRATDISSNMIDIARAKAADAGIGNVDFECVALADLEAEPASFNVVLGLSILHLLPDWRDVIARVHGLLKPGGIFVTSTACLNDGFGFMRPIAPLGRWLGLLPDLAFFGKDDLLGTMTSAGFEIKHEWLPGPRKAVFIIARRR